MQFKKDQYIVKRSGGFETITITKGALADWALFYDKKVANADSKMVRDYCAGRRDVLFDIISHFFAGEELAMKESKIEERAKESVIWDCGNEEFNTSVEQYIKGATEQKTIDIDKACEWLCKTCEVGICPIERKCHRYKGFRKAMIEE